MLYHLHSQAQQRLLQGPGQIPRLDLIVGHDLCAQWTGNSLNPAATARLVETLGGVIAGLGFVIELDDLEGRAQVGERTVRSLLHF